ncbi:MAG: hypothetical protein ABI432_07040 [Flavobacteriales bacterium]
MKKFLKWTGIVILLLVVVFLITVFSRQNLTFEAPYPDITASADSAVIAHGEYLVHGPAHCTGCHTDKAHEAAFLRGEEVPLHGGFPFELPIGTIYTRNITNDKEHGVGRLTDGEIARTLR